MVRDPEGVQPSQTDGHPCATYAAPDQVLAPPQGHCEEDEPRGPPGRTPGHGESRSRGFGGWEWAMVLKGVEWLSDWCFEED